MPHKRLTARLWAAALLCALAGVAHAERADRDKPINLDANRVTLDDKTKTSTYEGKVVLTQGTLLIQADRVQVRQGDDGVQWATATGSPVHFRQKRDASDEYAEGYARRVEYDARNSLFQMFDHAILTQGHDEVRGSHITYNVATGNMVVNGGQGSGQSDGRVHAVIQPKKARQ